jgi:hypothetical protein
MSDKRQLCQGGIATARKPRLVVAGAIAFVGRATEQLQMRGWEVVNVPIADAVRAALTRKPTVMLIPDETGNESGYLIAAKVLEARRRLKVVLVGARRTPAAERFAKFLGASFVAETDNVNRQLAAIEC